MHDEHDLRQLTNMYLGLCLHSPLLDHSPHRSSSSIQGTLIDPDSMQRKESKSGVVAKHSILTDSFEGIRRSSALTTLNICRRMSNTAPKNENELILSVIIYFVNCIDGKLNHTPASPVRININVTDDEKIKNAV